jgi:hypothetical protein
MGSICFGTPFSLMNWSWTPTITEPIHFYHSKLWEENAKDSFYEICHNVVIPIHEIIYGQPPPIILEKIIGNLGAIANWYMEESFSYIIVFSCFTSPHVLPKFLPNKLFYREVAIKQFQHALPKNLSPHRKYFCQPFLYRLVYSHYHTLDILR